MRQMHCHGPMPYGWQQLMSVDGSPYFLNVVHKRATWIDPRLEYLGCFRKKTERLGKLPDGWEVSMDDNAELFFYNSYTHEISRQVPTKPAHISKPTEQKETANISTTQTPSKDGDLVKIVRSNTMPSIASQVEKNIIQEVAPVFMFSSTNDNEILKPSTTQISNIKNSGSAPARNEELRQRLLKGNATEVLRQKLQRSMSVELNERLASVNGSLSMKKSKLVGSSSMPNVQHPLAQECPTFNAEEWEDIALPRSPPEWCSVQMAGSPRASPFNSISSIPQLVVALSTKTIELQDVPRPKYKPNQATHRVSSEKLPRKSTADVKPFNSPQVSKQAKTQGLKQNLATQVGNEFASNLPGLDDCDSKNRTNGSNNTLLSKSSYTNTVSTSTTSSPILQRLRSSAENLLAITQHGTSNSTSRTSSPVAGRTLTKMYTSSMKGKLHAAV